MYLLSYLSILAIAAPTITPWAIPKNLNRFVELDGKEGVAYQDGGELVSLNDKGKTDA